MENNWEVKFEISFHHNCHSIEREEIGRIERFNRAALSDVESFAVFLPSSIVALCGKMQRMKKRRRGKKILGGRGRRRFNWFCACKKWQNNWIPSTLWFLIINFHFHETQFAALLLSFDVHNCQPHRGTRKTCWSIETLWHFRTWRKRWDMSKVHFTESCSNVI